MQYFNWRTAITRCWWHWTPARMRSCCLLRASFQPAPSLQKVSSQDCLYRTAAIQLSPKSDQAHCSAWTMFTCKSGLPMSLSGYVHSHAAVAKKKHPVSSQSACCTGVQSNDVPELRSNPSFVHISLLQPPAAACNCRRSSR